MYCFIWGCCWWAEWTFFFSPDVERLAFAADIHSHNTCWHSNWLYFLLHFLNSFHTIANIQPPLSRYRPTIGADFLITDLKIDGIVCTLQIWDTAGQERFQSLGVAFYRGTDCYVGVFSVTNRASYQALPKHIEEFFGEVNRTNNRTVPVIIVGTKADITERAVPKEEASQWAERHGYPYYEVSSMTLEGIQELRQAIELKALEEAILSSEAVDIPPIVPPSAKPSKCVAQWEEQELRNVLTVLLNKERVPKIT